MLPRVHETVIDTVHDRDVLNVQEIGDGTRQINPAGMTVFVQEVTAEAGAEVGAEAEAVVEIRAEAGVTAEVVAEPGQETELDVVYTIAAGVEGGQKAERGAVIDSRAEPEDELESAKEADGVAKTGVVVLAV